MENPSTWGDAEKVIRCAYDTHSEARAKGVVGLSLIRTIADALREAGLLTDVTKVNRFEVIDHTGRALVRYGTKVELALQDEERTLKVFLEDRSNG